ncbi:MAG: ATP synthase F1 subunit epsilon [Actinomycetota bacterium]|nr:ATP synthase F1 subunit epsilon [Actinomycetota bacterium]|tara:strand:- start:1801 stop:2184 length:384 start_codon:yes stop_codon:yes gene_type:complete
MHVELVSPEAVLFSGECSQVVTRTVDGDIAFLDNHAPFIGALDIGQTQLWATDGVVSLAINGGFVEVSGNAVTILSDGALEAQDINSSEAESDLAAAEDALASDADDADAANAKKWAEIRIQVATGA